MKFGFVTCVQLGLSCLEELRRMGAKPDLLITLEDDMARAKSGRIYLDDFAMAAGSDLIKVRHINSPPALDAVRATHLDWLFIIGWSQIAGAEILALPRHGCVGMHPTLLPVGRGRASIPWAIIKGLKQTGVSMFVLDEGVDTGPLIAQEVIPLSPDETATTLYAKVDAAHIALIRRTWPDFDAGSVKPRPQEEAHATEWPGRRPEDGIITEDLSSEDVDRLVRALAPPYPGARFVDEDGRTWVISPDDGTSARTPLAIPTSDGAYAATQYRELAPNSESAK